MRERSLQSLARSVPSSTIDLQAIESRPSSPSLSRFSSFVLLHPSRFVQASLLIHRVDPWPSFTVVSTEQSRRHPDLTFLQVLHEAISVGGEKRFGGEKKDYLRI
ncbi:hypothetical protein FSOLCH5_005394 [Fusarium solani]|jgi:hypothetical protein